MDVASKFPGRGNFAHFLCSHTGLEDDDEWEFEKPLGQGGWGGVGLWVQRGPNGNIARACGCNLV